MLMRRLAAGMVLTVVVSLAGCHSCGHGHKECASPSLRVGPPPCNSCGPTPGAVPPPGVVVPPGGAVPGPAPFTPGAGAYFGPSSGQKI